MRRIAVTSEKGGVGKSTLSFNLSGALTDQGQRVLLVDEDVRVQSCLEWSRLADVPFRVIRPEEVAEGIKAVQPTVLLVDTEGRPEVKDMKEMLQQFDLVLIPTGPSRLEIASTLRLWAQLRGAPGADRLRVVVTRVPPVGRVGMEARDALRAAGVPVIHTVVRRLTAHERAAEVGGLTRDVADPRAGEAWRDITALAKEIRG
jgi:chromosome partitioning protein